MQTTNWLKCSLKNEAWVDQSPKNHSVAYDTEILELMGNFVSEIYIASQGAYIG